MRTENPLPTAATSAHPVSERTWKALFGVHGACPPHNTFVHMATLKKEISRTRARDDYQILKNLPDGHIFQEDATVTQTTTRETPVPVRAEAAEVTALREQVQQHAQEVQHLRAQVAGLEEQLGLVVTQVEGHASVVSTVQDLLTLLSTSDDAFDSFARLIRPVSTHSQRSLQLYLWGKIGRKLHQNDMIAVP